MSEHRVQIRPAIPADVEAIRGCVAAAYELYVARIGKKPAPMLDDYERLIADGVVSIATLDGEVVGAIVAWPNEDHFYVDNIAVLPAAQGTGVGTVLLDHVDARAVDAGRDEVRLYTNVTMVENIDYYPRRGFTETHRAADAGYERVYYSRPVFPPQG